MRIGHGYDAHQYESGTEIVLGGVTIACDKAIKAHSDGDVLVHAICDALLGAAALGDLGKHFPSADAKFADADSRALLKHVLSLLKELGYSVVNIDSTVVAQAPKLSGHIQGMRENIAADLAMTLDQVSVKATTTDHLGFIGKEEGLAAHAVVLITKE